MGELWTIRPEVLSDPPSITHNASTELRKLDLVLELTQRLKEEGMNLAECEKLRKTIAGKANHVERIRQELASLDERRMILVKDERNTAKWIRLLEERQAELVQDQDFVFSERVPTQHLWDELRHTEDATCGDASRNTGPRSATSMDLQAQI